MTVPPHMLKCTLDLTAITGLRLHGVVAVTVAHCVVRKSVVDDLPAVYAGTRLKRQVKHPCHRKHCVQLLTVARKSVDKHLLHASEPRKLYTMLQLSGLWTKLELVLPALVHMKFMVLQTKGRIS